MERSEFLRIMRSMAEDDQVKVTLDFVEIWEAADEQNRKTIRGLLTGEMVAVVDELGENDPGTELHKEAFEDFLRLAILAAATRDPDLLGLIGRQRTRMEGVLVDQEVEPQKYRLIDPTHIAEAYLSHRRVSLH